MKTAPRTRCSLSSGCSSSAPGSRSSPSISPSGAPSPSGALQHLGPRWTRNPARCHAPAEGQPRSPASPRRLTPGSWHRRPPAARSGHLCTQLAVLLNKRYADWMPGSSRANQSGTCWRVRPLVPASRDSRYLSVGVWGFLMIAASPGELSWL